MNAFVLHVCSLRARARAHMRAQMCVRRDSDHGGAVCVCVYHGVCVLCGVCIHQQSTTVWVCVHGRVEKRARSRNSIGN